MRGLECYCDNLEKVENYEAAKKDDFKGWHCHHRLETHTSDGERRLVDLSQKELIALDMYYHRPADELIFLTVVEHNNLHHKGKKRGPMTEEQKKKMSEALKGKPAWNKGKTMSEEQKAKLSTAMKGKKHGPMTEEQKAKISEAKKGKKRGPMSEEQKKKLSESCKGKPSSRKGKHWKLVDGKRVWY